MNGHLTHLISEEDRAFKEKFERGGISPKEFNHECHVRIAYIFLCEADPEHAYSKMRNALLQFLSHHGIDPQKYHETLTQAWMLAVHHFMWRSRSSASSLDFISQNPMLKDSRIMLTHYSKEKLFGGAARGEFVEPDLEPIPRHSKL